ncbi:MAG: DUF5916 domain-containing protein [Balneolaceae bacterium]
MKKIMITALILFGYHEIVSAQHSYREQISVPENIRSGTAPIPVMDAVRITNEPLDFDGFLNEKIWRNIPAATDFTQRFPDDGRSATQKTEVKLLFTDEFVFVGIMAFDSSPDSISAPLFRRDGNQSSDWVYVSFDSYNDKRTAFSFAVNPRGVQKDVLYYDDNNEDVLWDAVWEAKTQVLANGWSAELKIPLSQLRFSSKNEEQLWGVNFQRRISRTGEISFWAPTPENATGVVSKFGRLNGIRELKEPRRLEITPYVSGSLVRLPRPVSDNPYYSTNLMNGNVGGDIKYGLTSDLTLTATINPDFGQVEADPAVINLTANESFFSERRPFFLEGNDIFSFGNTQTYSSFGNPATFYSRRIGRSPQGGPQSAGVNAEFSDQPDFTTIATAAKLSGKTKSGWSVGFLDAYTLQENALYRSAAGVEESIAAEPASNYAVGRVKKDLNSGNTYFGGFASAVNRNINNTYFEDFLRSSAYLGGVDFEHNFNDRNWVTSGTLSYSVINGSEQAIYRAQVSPARYYNRVDSGKLSTDQNKTSLAGFATEISLQKRGGDDPWLGSLTYSEVSPGYETNDLGFQNRADYRSLNGGIVYRDTDPRILQYYEFWLFTGNAWNYDGDRINHNYGTGGMVRLKNLWRLNFNANYNGPNTVADRTARGGPVMVRPVNGNFNMNINSNPNKKISFNAGTFLRKDEFGGYIRDFWSAYNVRPTPWLQLSFSPEVILQKDRAQYITTINDADAVNTYGNRYIFSDIEQTTLMASFRLDWTFSTTMSLQTYVRPFISSGKYTGFKELAAPASYDFDIYGEETGTISSGNGEYTVDPDGNGPADSFSFQNPDFNFRSIQGNAVFRWEYIPGSTLFLVWQQQRDDFFESGRFDLRRDLDGLFGSEPTNVFLVKASYWFGS